MRYLTNTGEKSMHANTSSSGVSEPNERATSGLTIRDSLRQETPGGPLPGLDVKATEN
jgi:hypothetical protein